MHSIITAHECGQLKKFNNTRIHTIIIATQEIIVHEYTIITTCACIIDNTRKE